MSTPDPDARAEARRWAAWCVVAAVALLHVLGAGRVLHGAARVAYASWFSDVAIPFAGYFMLFLPRRRWPVFDDWRGRAAIVLGAASLAETLQALGVPALGRTFDPLDYAMYAAGTALAVAADRWLLEPALRRRRDGTFRGGPELSDGGSMPGAGRDS